MDVSPFSSLMTAAHSSNLQIIRSDVTDVADLVAWRKFNNFPNYQQNKEGRNVRRINTSHCTLVVTIHHCGNCSAQEHFQQLVKTAQTQPFTPQAFFKGLVI